MMLTTEEKKKYIFPEDWDISAAFRVPSSEDVGGDVYTGEEDQYRICGNSLLLEKAAGSCGLREDLTTVFDTDIANRLLSISYFLMQISGVWA